MEHIKKHLKKYTSSNANLNEIISEDSEYNFGNQLAEEFVSKLGTDKFPQVRFLVLIFLTNSYLYTRLMSSHN